MSVSAAYQGALDAIFAGYLREKDRIAGRPDREVRTPEALVALAERLALVPDPARLVRVSGSKGKGSVTRLVAAMLAQARPGEPVGRITSPEEIEHTDRIQVDGRPITEAEFARIWAALAPEVETAARALPPGRYLSPSGLFLLVGLAWFRERGVAHVVLEGGRGVRWDEVGRLRSRVGVVTSIFLEHPEYLGPTLSEIAADKLAMLDGSEIAVLGPLARPFAAPGGAFIGVEPPTLPLAEAPSWLAEDAAIAAAAAGAYLGRACAPPDPLPSLPSFGRAWTGGVPVTYEGLIAADSFDAAFWRRELGRGRRPLALLSLPDDKDVSGVAAAFAGLGIPVQHLVLEGERGRLSHALAEASGAIAGRLRYDDAEACTAALRSTLAHTGADRLALAGTQTFLRLVRRALGKS
ncbi:folylpolyglutamate synthase/dihydrofolate synthase family protein [Arenibaculum pallidiluteum]|uniref:hypothetical protein n=1 Tax=Arenibaculum pallidiluteum TaxID=2812559 RepID=UPI001A96E24D|nr:hypothetical protein [Arenibaculum pallidiluteum]